MNVSNPLIFVPKRDTFLLKKLRTSTELSEPLKETSGRSWTAPVTSERLPGHSGGVSDVLAMSVARKTYFLKKECTGVQKWGCKSYFYTPTRSKQMKSIEGFPAAEQFPGRSARPTEASTTVRHLPATFYARLMRFSLCC